MDEGGPTVFVFDRDGFDHNFHEVGAGLNSDNVEDAAFGFHEERFGFSIGVWFPVLVDDSD